MLPPVRNPYVFLAFPYVSSCRAKDILSFFSADSAYGDALSIFIDLCTVDHSILYTKGAFCVCTAWVHDVSIVSQCLFSISSHRAEEQSVGRFQQVHWLECTRLGHRYHRGALPLPGLGIFPTGMGQISFAFLHFVVSKVFFFISLTRVE